MSDGPAMDWPRGLSPLVHSGPSSGGGPGHDGGAMDGDGGAVGQGEARQGHEHATRVVANTMRAFAMMESGQRRRSTWWHNLAEATTLRWREAACRDGESL